jgi:hypothetical protein
LCFGTLCLFPFFQYMIDMTHEFSLLLFLNGLLVTRFALELYWTGASCCLLIGYGSDIADSLDVWLSKD